MSEISAVRELDQALVALNARYESLAAGKITLLTFEQEIKKINQQLTDLMDRKKNPEIVFVSDEVLELLNIKIAYLEYIHAEEKRGSAERLVILQVLLKDLLKLKATNGANTPRPIPAVAMNPEV